VSSSEESGTKRRGASLASRCLGLERPRTENSIFPHPSPRWAPRPDVGVIIGWPGATIPLLTAFIPDAILVATASWPGNLVRGTKLRRQEV
jgi:hypothetical protein